MTKCKTLLVSAENAGTIDGKKTTTIADDIDKAVNGLGVDIKAVSTAPAGSAFSDQIIVTVLYEGSSDDDKHGGKKK
jgi:hypothetical protein